VSPGHPCPQAVFTTPAHTSHREHEPCSWSSKASPMTLQRVRVSKMFTGRVNGRELCTDPNILASSGP